MDLFFPTRAERRPAFVDLLRAMGRDLGVGWTRLRPDDRFDDAFMLKGIDSDVDDIEEASLGRFLGYQEEWFLRYGLDWKKRNGAIETLGDYLREIDGLFDVAQGRYRA